MSRRVVNVLNAGVDIRAPGENVNLVRKTATLQGIAKPRTVLTDVNKVSASSKNRVDQVDQISEEKLKKAVQANAAKKQVPNMVLQMKKPVVKVAPVEARPSEPVAYSTNMFALNEVSAIEDIDCDNNNPQLVSCYAKDIYSYLRDLEKKFSVRENYMEGYHIRPTMRTILVDWLVDVHGRFKMLQETLYLTVSVMDSYLQADPSVVRRDLQLVGITAMLIAAKFEETWAPEVNDFVYMSDKAYTKKEVLQMECRMLQALDFRMGRPLPLHFLRRNTQAASQLLDQVDVLHHTLSKYLMELTLPEYDFRQHLPSELAAAAICLSLKILDESEGTEEIWNASMVYYSGYTKTSLEPLMKKLCTLIVTSETSKFQAIRKKYMTAKLYNISTIPHLRSALVVNMAKKAGAA